MAITLAGSYVSVTTRLSSNIRRYLLEYRERRKELLRRRAKRHIHQYGESVLSTWEASFEAIENQNPAAARLLSLLAFVNFEDILVSSMGTGPVSWRALPIVVRNHQRPRHRLMRRGSRSSSLSSNGQYVSLNRRSRRFKVILRFSGNRIKRAIRCTSSNMHGAKTGWRRTGNGS